MPTRETRGLSPTKILAPLTGAAYRVGREAKSEFGEEFGIEKANYGDASDILNGIDRRIWGKDNGYWGKTNQAITYTFDKPTFVNGFRLVVDSDLDRENFDGHPDLFTIPMPMFRGLGYNNTSFTFPRTVLKHFRVDVKGADGEWTTAFETKENHQRLVRGKIGRAYRVPRHPPHAALDMGQRAQGKHLRQRHGPHLRVRAGMTAVFALSARFLDFRLEVLPRVVGA